MIFTEIALAVRTYAQYNFLIEKSLLIPENFQFFDGKNMKFS